MKSYEEIYLIGPGSSKSEFDTDKLKNKIIFQFSDDLRWYDKTNIYPTYWSFLDPTSTTYIVKNYKNKIYNLNWFEGLKQNTNIIFNDFQGTDLFYDLGFTTKLGKIWNKNEFGKHILPATCSYFKDTIKLQSIVLNNNFSQLYTTNYKDVCPIIQHESNIDKFTCYVLPLVISYFSDLKHINCIGFGDFDSPRMCNNSSSGYSGYMKSYDLVKNDIIELLKYKNITIYFHNKNSYFKDLEWKK